MVLVFLQKRQPRLDDVRVAVLDLDQAAHGDALKVLLRLFEDEIRARDDPALCYPWEGHGAPRTESHVVGGAHGEVGEEEQAAHVVGAQLQVARRHAMFRGAPEGAQVHGADVDGCAEGFEGFGGFGIERGFVGGEGDAFFSRNGVLDVCVSRRRLDINWRRTLRL